MHSRVRTAITTEILNVDEVAELLRLAEKTASTAQRRELPAFKIRGQRRISRADLNEWITAQRRAIGPKK
jgi:excisionase family DNA binding protein